VLGKAGKVLRYQHIVAISRSVTVKLAGEVHFEVTFTFSGDGKMDISDSHESSFTTMPCSSGSVELLYKRGTKPWKRDISRWVEATVDPV
jgi:hypothetical protein